ncbi:restriction endonuclease subunit S [Faecalicoccus pleomorphus]|uniref:restriction endonuclease subunit S n=1 Tax=Faecalicoccus pleomorphus TaxID=1323 RepID=UPI0039F5349A
MPYEKVGKNDPVCIADQVPFEIPDSWEWVHLSDIAISGLGKTLNKSMDEGTDTPYLCSINVYWTGIDLSTVKTAKFTQTDREKYLLQKGDLLICEGGDVGRSAIWNYDTEMYYQNALHRVRFLGKINPYFFLYLLECYRGLKIIEEYSKGVTIKHFVQSSLNSMFLPLPPLNEQQRIVDKINEILTIVANYDTTYSRVTKLNEAFPDALKRSILQWAIQGKLVPQDPNDEPASVLLERIREEKQRLVKEGKIKKDKHESIIFRRDNSYYEKLDGIERCIDDEIPFEIPDNWEWARLGFVSTYTEMKKKIKAQNVSPHIWQLDLEDIEKGGRIIERKTVGERKATGDKIFFETGNVLYSKLRPYLLKVLVAPADGICTPEIVPFTLYGDILSEYVVIFLKSSYVNDVVNSATYGVKMPRVGTQTMADLLLPLPPLNEQHQIVKKVEDALSHIGNNKSAQ